MISAAKRHASHFGRAFGLRWLVGAAAVTASCVVLTPIPDQSRFLPLSELRHSGQALVRLYAAPIPGIELIASHSWFVVKPASSSTYNRWEVWIEAAEPYGHVRKNMLEPESDIGAPGAYVVAELIGAEAELVVEFIESQSPTYPCKDRYLLLGPDSNSYAQWVLDNTGWDVALPCTAIGKETPAVCDVIRPQ